MKFELRSGSKWQPQALTPTEAPEKSLMTATFVGQEMRQNATSMHRYLVPPEKEMVRDGETAVEKLCVI